MENGACAYDAEPRAVPAFPALAHAPTAVELVSDAEAVPGDAQELSSCANAGAPAIRKEISDKVIPCRFIFINNLIDIHNILTQS
ncbi:hypothetical protein ECPV1028_46000 [Escherichia coli]